MKKTIFKKIVPIMIASTMFLGATAVYSDRVYAAESSVSKITVSGEGTVTVKPDIAYLSLGVTSEAKDSKTAKSMNESQMSKLISVMKEAGIDDNDIQTSNYSIYPQRNYNGDNQIIGYTVTNMVNITIRDLDSAGDILDKAIEAGANTGSGIQFSIEDTSEYYAKALVLAINNAKSKASVIAGALDVTIASASEITETSRGSVYTAYYGESAAVAYDKGVSIETGTLKITASVQAVYNY